MNPRRDLSMNHPSHSRREAGREFSLSRSRVRGREGRGEGAPALVHGPNARQESGRSPSP